MTKSRPKQGGESSTSNLVGVQRKKEKQVPDPGAGAWFRILGGKSFFEGDVVVNGYYVQQPTLRGGKPCFMRISHQVDDDPMVIWWLEKRHLWMINLQSQIGSENARAVAKQTDSEHPLDVENGWLEFNGNSKSFDKSEIFEFRKAKPEEETKHKIQRVEFAGRTGYNRFMNGIYERGEKLHHGRPYYEHIDPQLHFKIRWFQTKWVVDWREGLKSDNIGCAVCKADAPEPWMCNIPWRIYDAKKTDDKKWDFDPDVKLTAMPNTTSPSQTPKTRG